MIVSDIKAALEARVATLLPAYKKSPFDYFFEHNNRKTSKKIYGIRIGAGSTTSGVVGSVTLDQSFEVILSDIYQIKADTDRDLEEKILSIHTDIETIYKEVYQKRLDLTSAKVLLVEMVDLATPQIDTDNNTVSISVTFRVRYRTQI